MAPHLEYSCTRPPHSTLTGAALCDRVWACEIPGHTLSVIYNASDYISPILTEVDNITLSRDGSLYGAEDGGRSPDCRVIKCWGKL